MPSAGVTAAGYIVLFFSNTLSSSAGVGGGLLNVAIIHSILGHSFKGAVVLSLAAILGNTLLQLMINIRTRHPNCPKRSVIYWEMIAIMLPAELGGSNLGVVLSKVVPSTILYIGAIIVLMLGGTFSLKKGLHLYELENQRHLGTKAGDKPQLATANPIVTSASQSSSIEDTLQRVVSLLSIEEVDVDAEPRKSEVSRTSLTSLTGAGVVDPSEDAAVYKSNSNEAPPLKLPWFVIRVVCAVWLCYLVLYIVMSLVPSCSTGWGLVLVFIYLILLFEVPWAFRYLMQEQAAHPEEIVSGDVLWTPSTFAVPVVTFSIGLLTALLGFGGGELIGPYLLHLHIPPLVSTSTSGMISFLNTGLSLIHYGILGKVQYAESAVVFVIGMCAGLSGRLFSLAFVAKFDRASALIFTLVAVLGLSWIVYILYIATDKVSFEFDHLC